MTKMFVPMMLCFLAIGAHVGKDTGSMLAASVIAVAGTIESFVVAYCYSKARS